MVWISTNLSEKICTVTGETPVKSCGSTVMGSPFEGLSERIGVTPAWTVAVGEAVGLGVMVTVGDWVKVGVKVAVVVGEGVAV